MSRKEIVFNGVALIFVITFFSGCHFFQTKPKPVIGILKGGVAEKWYSELKNRYQVKYVNPDTIKQDLNNIDVLIVADAPVDKRLAGKIEKFYNQGGKIIGVGKAGYSNGHYNLTKLLRAGKHTMSIAVLYPATLTPDEMVAMSKWAAQGGADGISVFTYGTMRYGKVPKDGRKDVKEGKLESEYTKKMKPVIKTEFQKWMKKDSLVPYGMPEVPKMLWGQVWGQLKSKRRPRLSPEEFVRYAKEMGFNIICTEMCRDGYFTHESQFNVPPDHGSNPANFDFLPALVKECEKEGIQLWANISTNGQSGVYWRKHPDQRRVGITGNVDRRVCPRAGKAYYDWQLKVVDELLRKFPYISGVDFDEPEVSGCCPVCRQVFKKRFGYEMKKIDDPNLTKFSQELNTKFVIAPLIKTVKKVNPLINIGITTPAGASSFLKCGTNLSEWADAGYNVWGFEMPRRYAFRGGRAYLNIEASRTYHTPRKFKFSRLDDLSGKNQVKIAGNGIKTDLFRGAVPMYWMDNGKMKFPGVVKNDNGKTAYFAFDPLATDAGKKLFFEILNGMKGRKNNE